MEKEVTAHANDVVMKAMTGMFGDRTLKVFGLRTARIVSVFATEVPVVEVKDGLTDFIFVLEDNTLLHLEFQTTTRREDLKRFMLYDARLANRDERNIQTAVIYSGKIEEAPAVLRRGSITYQVTNVYMKAYDGDKEYARLHEKIEAGQALDEDDLLKLVFLPLMKSKSSEAQMTIQAAKLAKTMPEEKRNLALGVLIALGDRFLSDADMKKLMEVLSMTRFAQWFREEGKEEGELKAKIETAKAALREGSSVEFVIKITGLPRETVLRLKSEVEQEHLATLAEGSRPGC